MFKYKYALMFLTFFCFAYTKNDTEQAASPMQRFIAKEMAKEQAQIKIDHIFNSVVNNLNQDQARVFSTFAKESILNNLEDEFLKDLNEKRSTLVAGNEVWDLIIATGNITADTSNETVEQIITDASNCVNTIKTNKAFGFKKLLTCITLAIKQNNK